MVKLHLNPIYNHFGNHAKQIQRFHLLRYIVEDILSSIKCYNKCRYDTLALLNSTITNELMNQIKHYKQIFVWLDPDAHIKALKFMFQMKSRGINATTIRTNKDPKDIPYNDFPKI